MKNVILAIVCLFGFTYTGQAQEISENALGLRFGGGNGYGLEVSFQHHINGNHRLEFDLGFRNDHNFGSFKLTGLYQWVWNIEGGFNWYAGAGVGIGSVNAKDYYVDKHPHTDDGAFALIAGNIGIEYLFDVPIQVFIDFRPEIILADYGVYNSFGPDLAIGVRYRF